MSFGGFGVSVGDAFAIGNFAWNLYKACKSAPGKFASLSKEVASLHTAIQEVSDEVRNADSLLNYAGAQKKTELEEILANCRGVLTDLEHLLSKHNSLGNTNEGGKGKVWDRLRFGSKDLDSVREKLVFYTSAISLFLQTLGTGSLRRIEKRLDELIQEARSGRRETTTFMIFGEQNEPKDVYWNGLQNAIQDEDITQVELDAHQNGIRAYLQEQVMKFDLPIRAQPIEVRSLPEVADLTDELPPPEQRTSTIHSILNDSSGNSFSQFCSTTNSSQQSSDRRDSQSERRPALPHISTFFPEHSFQPKSGAYEESTTDVQEYDDQGRLRRRTVTRQSSNSSMMSNIDSNLSFPLPRPSSTGDFTGSIASPNTCVDVRASPTLPPSHYPPPVHQDLGPRTNEPSTGRKAYIPYNNTHGSYELVTMDTDRDPYQIPVDVQAASKIADEKRKRNPGASARFRERRKLKEREQTQGIANLEIKVHDLEETAARLEGQVRDLTEERDFYRIERDYFRGVVYDSPAQAHVTPRPPSPWQRNQRLPSTAEPNLLWASPA